VCLSKTVVLHSFNCLEYPLIFFALNRLGAICSPSSPLFNANELADQIEVSDVRLTFTLPYSFGCRQ